MGYLFLAAVIWFVITIPLWLVMVGSSNGHGLLNIDNYRWSVEPGLRSIVFVFLWLYFMVLVGWEAARQGPVSLGIAILQGAISLPCLGMMYLVTGDLWAAAIWLTVIAFPIAIPVWWLVFSSVKEIHREEKQRKRDLAMLDEP
ncbi:MAG: hypothetical protein SGI92_25550 [Bryobacteraceae bacterium]|nr:hypothetical protein [Bryobacteraceae bacterium]